MKKYAYKTTKLTEHENRTFPALSAVVGLDNLYSGQIIEDISAFVEKLEFFQKYSEDQGLYIVDDTCQEYGDKGLHFYYWSTILHQIKWSNHSPDPRYLKDYRMTVHYEHGLFFEFKRKGQE